MWQQEKKDSSIINLALLLAFATTPMAVALFMSMPVLAKSTTYTSFFPLPQTVEKGTIIRVDGSSDLMKINQSLKEDFEQQFYGTKIDIGVNGNEVALKALQDGKIDVATITRKLTPEEKSQGLEQIVLSREKIAIIVGVNNPFQGSLTKKQLAGIFTGEIRDWSQLGGTARPIRVINYPPDSDIRNAFQSSSIFKTKIGTGANVTELPLENIAEVIQKLGNDGISYVLANQVSQVQNVRAIQLNSADLNQSNSSISMPLVYAYKKNHSQGVSSFLGFTLGRPGQEAIDTARKIESSSVAINALQSFAMEPSSGNYNESSNYLKPEVSPTVTNAVNTAVATVAPTSTPTNAATLAPTSASTGFNATNNEREFVQPLSHSTEEKNELPIFLFPVLVVGLGALALRLIGRKRKTADEETETDYSVSDAGLVLDNQQNNSNGTVKLTEDTAIPSPNNVADNLSPNGAANLEQVAKNDQEELKDPEQSDALDSGEVLWDIEAPVAVVNTPYHQILNIPELGFGEEFTNSLLEPPDISAGASADNSPTSLSELLGIPAVASADNSPTSLSELLGIPAVASVNNSPASLSELLGIPAVASVNNNIAMVNNSDSPTSLSELLDVGTLTIGNSADNSASALSKLISSPGALSINDSPSALSELLDITTIGSIDSSPSYLLDLLDLPVAIPIDNSPSALSELLGVPRVQPDVDIADSLSDLDFPVIAESEPDTPDTGDVLTDFSLSDLDFPTVEETEPDTTDVLTDSPVSDLDLDFPVIAESEPDTPDTADVLTDFSLSDLDFPTVEETEPDTTDVLTDSPVSDSPVSDLDLDFPVIAESELDITDVLTDFSLSDLDFPAVEETEPDTTDVLADSLVSDLDLDFPAVEETEPDTTPDTTDVLADSLVSDLDLDFPAVEETEPDTTDVLTDSPVSDLDLDFPAVEEITETETETSHPSESTSENITLVESKIIEAPSDTDSTHEQPQSEKPKQNNVEGTNFSILDSDSNIILTPRTPKWAYVSWYVSEASQKVVQNQNLALVVRIYDVTHLDLSYQSPQLVQQYECEEGTHDRYVAISINDRDYIAEIGYCNQENNWFCIARSGLVRIFSRPRTDLWIATDTELVIYGATEPGTTVTIDGQNIQLKSDGTFQLHLPFIDSEVSYLFTATSSSGEQTKTINKKFSQVSN